MDHVRLITRAGRTVWGLARGLTLFAAAVSMTCAIRHLFIISFGRCLCVWGARSCMCEPRLYDRERRVQSPNGWFFEIIHDYFV